MCGIVGYVGPRAATPILIEGLRKLEYRGYDSAGLAVHDGKTIEIVRAAGKLSKLDDALIKLHMTRLASERTSCRSPRANRFHLILPTAALPATWCGRGFRDQGRIRGHRGCGGRPPGDKTVELSLRRCLGSPVCGER